MKKLICLNLLAFNLTLSAQSFPLRNVNDEYVLTNLDMSGIPKKKWHEIIRDENGMYWFQSLTDLYSFDGVYWKSYNIQAANGTNAMVRFNDLEVTDDNRVWVATEGSVYLLDRASDRFIPMRQAFPGIKLFPRQVGCFFEGPNMMIFRPAAKEGLYLFDCVSQQSVYFRIDTTEKITVPSAGTPVVTDKSGNIWGITLEKKGIWQYNIATGKVRCSWKGELPMFNKERSRQVQGIVYDENENQLWVTYPRMVERMQLPAGPGQVYTFSGNLKVSNDTGTVNKYNVAYVKIDKDNNKWVLAGKHLVKLHSELSRMEYLVHDPETFPIGTWDWFKPVTTVGKSRTQEENILLWVFRGRNLSIIRKKNKFVRQVPYDTLSGKGIKPADYVNTNARKFIFLARGRNHDYLLFQKNPGRPKLISFSENFKTNKVLFADKWKEYPVYFSTDFSSDTFHIALLRPGTEPLDFRTVVEKDFSVDLRTLMVKEQYPDFRQRVRLYGRKDRENQYWLYSNGYLYSFDPGKDQLDSIFLCRPAEKGPYLIDGEGLIKGFDYPVYLHKPSSTYWICFISSGEVYKVNLTSRKTEKIFKCCIDQADCDIPGMVTGFSDFDSSHLALKSNFTSLILDVKTHAFKKITDLIRNIKAEQHFGTGSYRDWIYAVRESGVYFLNQQTGEHKRIILNEDYTWESTALSSPPLVNDRGEMILMSSVKKGFLVFNIDSVAAVEKPGKVDFSFIRLDNASLPVDSLRKKGSLTLRYNRYRSIQFGFTDFTVYGQDKMIYDYTLYKGGDTVWTSIEGKPELGLSELSPGKYQLLLRAGNGNGGYSEEITVFPVEIIPPFSQTAWFVLLLIAGITGILFGLYRYRLYQMKRLLTIRNNIASDLHDDIGSTLNSISIYSEVAKQQAGKDIPALDLIGINSRKIVESMSDIVWTINPENDSFEKIIVRMRSFAHQLLKAKRIEYTFEADDLLNTVKLPMQVRKNFYMVFKEAVTNLVKYSGATRVSIDMKGEEGTIFLRIRDNGKGILISPETMGNGLMNMKRRAAEIKAILKIESENNLGTGVELKLKL